MKRLLRRAAMHLACAVLNPVYSGIGTILCLHRVVERGGRPRIGSNTALEISPKDLAQIIAQFRAANYDIVSMDEVHSILTSGRKTKKFAAFSFDDGYTEMLTTVLPIFKKANAPFAVNIATSFVGNPAALWWYRLEDLVLGRDWVTCSVAGRKKVFPAQSHEEKETAFEELSMIVRGLPFGQRDEFLAQVFESNSAPAPDPGMVMDWDQVRELADDPLVTIGAHTKNHYDSTRLSEDQMRNEFIGSREIIEAKVGVKVEHFAYPFGKRNAVGHREFAVARGCGFKTMATTRPANLFLEHANSLEALPRIGVSGNYPAQSRLKVMRTGAFAARQFRLRRVIVE